MIPRRRTAAALLTLFAATSCSEGGGTTTKASDTSLVPSPSTSAATGTGIETPTSASGAASTSRPTPGASGVERTTTSTEQTTSTQQQKPGSTSTTAAPGSTTTTTTTVPPGLPPEKCPDAKTCRRYAYKPFTPSRWPTGPNGRATVRYKVYPTNSQTSLSVDQVTRAIAEAFATWQRAAPTLEFVFDGMASTPPTGGDGVNTVGFSPTDIRAGIATDNGRITEADMYLGTGNYVWHPCEQRDDSCTQVRKSGEGHDLQAIATHEAGHWLGLQDMPDDQLERELTMHPGSGTQMKSTDRFWVTLALGDVLGIRSLYPCSCPLPPIYSP